MNKAKEMKKLADEMNVKFDCLGNLLCSNIDDIYKIIERWAKIGEYYVEVNFNSIATEEFIDIVKKLEKDEFDVDIFLQNMEVGIGDLKKLITDWDRHTLNDVELDVDWSDIDD